MDAFLEELQKVRQGAIARDIGEINPQLHCYAVPVTFAGRVDCAMSVSLPAFRDTPEKHQQVESELRKAVAKLEQFMMPQAAPCSTPPTTVAYTSLVIGISNVMKKLNNVVQRVP